MSGRKHKEIRKKARKAWDSVPDYVPGFWTKYKRFWIKLFWALIGKKAVWIDGKWLHMTYGTRKKYQKELKQKYYDKKRKK